MRNFLVIVGCILAVTPTSLCRNFVVGEADAIVDDGVSNKIIPKRGRQSKEVKFDSLTRVTLLADQTDEQVEKNSDELEDSSSWSQLLEDWVVSHPTQTDRVSRQMYNTMARFGQQMPPPQPPQTNNNGFYIKRRMSEAAPLQQQTLRNDRQQPAQSFRPLPPALNFEQIRQTTADISETDLYLLSAIEKLVHRVDYLEKRLQTTDKLILHLLNDVRKDSPNVAQLKPIYRPSSVSSSTAQSLSSSSVSSATTTSPSPLSLAVSPPTTTTETTITSISSSFIVSSLKPTSKPTKPTKLTKPDAICPRDFTAIRSICYHIDVTEHSDWKTANTRCRQLGAQLAEFGTTREFKTVSEHLLQVNVTRISQMSGFWLGGLNPGLLWIWSSSARPVNSGANLAAFGGAKNSVNNTSVMPLKEKNVFDIQGNGRCLNLKFNQTLRSFEYFGDDCSRPLGFVCEMRNHNVYNEISRAFRALGLE